MLSLSHREQRQRTPAINRWLERLANLCPRPDTFLRFAHWRRAENLWISHARGPGAYRIGPAPVAPSDPPYGSRAGGLFRKYRSPRGAGAGSFSFANVHYFRGWARSREERPRSFAVSAISMRWPVGFRGLGQGVVSSRPSCLDAQTRTFRSCRCCPARAAPSRRRRSIRPRRGHGTTS